MQIIGLKGVEMVASTSVPPAGPSEKGILMTGGEEAKASATKQPNNGSVGEEWCGALWWDVAEIQINS